MSEKYFLRTLSKYTKKNARKVNNFLRFDADHNSLSVDYRDFGIPPSSAVHIARSKKEFKKSRKTDHGLIFYPRNGLLFFNENGSSKGFGRGGVVALFKKRSLLTPSDFLFSSGSETQSVFPDSAPAVPVSTSTTEAVFQVHRDLLNYLWRIFLVRSARLGNLIVSQSRVRLVMC